MTRERKKIHKKHQQGFIGLLQREAGKRYNICQRGSDGWVGWGVFVLVPRPVLMSGASQTQE